MKKNLFLVLAAGASLAACSPTSTWTSWARPSSRRSSSCRAGQGQGPDDRRLGPHLDDGRGRAPRARKGPRDPGLRQAGASRAGPLVRAVILRLDTPGGEVTASDIIYHEVLAFKERTRVPVVGLMMATTASGGYYIAMACDHLLAHPSSLTGSIGVISIFPDVHELLGKVGVRVNVIKSRTSRTPAAPSGR